MARVVCRATLPLASRLSRTRPAHLVAFVALGLALPLACAASPATPPRLFLIGGSTAASFPPERPVVGWGQILPDYFAAPGLVQNRARSGRSSKSFIDQGHWDAVLGELRAGDYLLACFGTNDAANDPARRTEPRGDFRANLERFIRETRAQGGLPLLATSVVRRQWDIQGNFIEPPSEWIVVTREVAAAQRVPLLDLRRRTVELERRLGPAGSKALHLYLPPGQFASYPKGATDDTHYNATGAREVALLVADELARLELPLARWLAPAPASPAPRMPVRGLCAHRGASGTHPENTLPALEEAVRLGVPMIELDLALTRDGELVLMHDATVDRTTNGKGRVRDLDLAAIRQLDAGTWKDARFAGTRVPTLAEALAVLPRHVWLNLDLKADSRWGPHAADVGRRVAEILVAAGRRHQAFLAARADIAAAARAAVPDILICSMDRTRDPAEYVRDAIARRVAFIQLRDCATDPRFPEWIAALRRAGVRINYFPVRHGADAARLFAAGVEFALVDDPAAALAGR